MWPLCCRRRVCDKRNLLTRIFYLPERLLTVLYFREKVSLCFCYYYFSARLDLKGSQA